MVGGAIVLVLETLTLLDRKRRITDGGLEWFDASGDGRRVVDLLPAPFEEVGQGAGRGIVGLLVAVAEGVRRARDDAGSVAGGRLRAGLVGDGIIKCDALPAMGSGDGEGGGVRRVG